MKLDALKAESETQSIISLRLKQARENRRMSLRDLSDKTGFSSSTLSRYELGQIDKLPCERLSIIAEALNVSPIWLMGFDGFDTLDPVEHEIMDVYRRANTLQKMKIGGFISEIADEIENSSSAVR